MIKHSTLVFICGSYNIWIAYYVSAVLGNKFVSFEAHSILMLQVVIQILDVDQLTSGYGYLLLFEAIGTLMGGPVAGMIIIFVA